VFTTSEVAADSVYITENTYKTGCSIAKKTAFGKLANDAPRNTRRRRARAAQKPNKKNLSHMPETKKSTIMPTVISATHSSRE
jgi:hypothetical protein